MYHFNAFIGYENITCDFFIVFKITVLEFCFLSTLMGSSFNQESSSHPSSLLKVRERNGPTPLTPLQQMICSSSGALVTSCFSKWNYGIMEKLDAICFMLVIICNVNFLNPILIHQGLKQKQSNIYELAQCFV